MDNGTSIFQCPPFFQCVDLRGNPQVKNYDIILGNESITALQKRYMKKSVGELDTHSWHFCYPGCNIKNTTSCHFKIGNRRDKNTYCKELKAGAELGKMGYDNVLEAKAMEKCLKRKPNKWMFRKCYRCKEANSKGNFIHVLICIKSKFKLCIKRSTSP